MAYPGGSSPPLEVPASTPKLKVFDRASGVFAPLATLIDLPQRLRPLRLRGPHHVVLAVGGPGNKPVSHALPYPEVIYLDLERFQDELSRDEKTAGATRRDSC